MISSIGITNAYSIPPAYTSGFLAGTANSSLDAGTYSSLAGAFPRFLSTANILIEVLVSSGQFLLPMIISLLVQGELWSGWSFLLAAAVMILNGMFSFRCRFPPHLGPHIVIRAQPAERETAQPEYHYSLLDLASYTLYGCIAMATFYLVSQWLAQYEQFVIGMFYTLPIKLLSTYTYGSLLCVLIIAPLAREAEYATSMLMPYTFISLAALLMICLHPTPYAAIVFASVIGFFSVGGIV